MTSPHIHKLQSGGYLVDLGDAFPVWRIDMGAVRRLLLERELQETERTVTATAGNRPDMRA